MEIVNYICELVYNKSSQNLSNDVAERFDISRQAAQKHIKKLVDTGILVKTGNTKGALYSLQDLVHESKDFKLSENSDEDVVWREFVRPKLGDVPDNVRSICQYGFTEMYNNAVDHSEGETITVAVKRTAYNIKLLVKDDGIGIFKKIKRDFRLEDERHAILELSKGKLTSDPSRHSGEGIFFTSRMFDKFNIVSGRQFFTHFNHNDWLLHEENEKAGTTVLMDISLFSKRTTKEVFDEYAKIDYPGFYKTIVPVVLAKYGDESLISRSQAKRVLAGVEKFSEVFFDFKEVSEVGQAFVDEIFRVFASEHPDLHLVYMNADESVEWMIKRALATGNTRDNVN
ncbi:MAG: DUF4325 domain-containing protein [Desulfuromonadales bacterium]|nr:DUF4325 domain-containing protein [Desulfuromonadales bacterium]